MKNGAIDAHICEKITPYINEKPIPACFGFPILGLDETDLAISTL